MSSSRFAIRSARVALLLPMVAFALGGHGYTVMVCRITGFVSLTDGCPGAGGDEADAAARGTEQSTAVDESCCDLVQVAIAHPPAERAGRAEPAPAAPIVRAPATRPRALASRTGARRAGPETPLGLGPPLRLVTQTFLI